MQHTIEATHADNTVTSMVCTRGETSALRMAGKIIDRGGVITLEVLNAHGVVIYTYPDTDEVTG